MNKIWLFGASMCMVLALGSCKPKQSAYKAAYEQAKEKVLIKKKKRKKNRQLRLR